MQYKTIALELLRQNPQVHEQLRQNRILLQAVNACAADLKARHHAWMDELRATRPQSDATQISSEALELALDDLRAQLAPNSPGGSRTAALTRRGNDLHSTSHAARVTAARGQPLLPFDAPPELDAAESEPTERIEPPSTPTLITGPPADFDHSDSLVATDEHAGPSRTVPIASGEKAKARDILAAIRTLQAHRAGAAAGHRRTSGRRSPASAASGPSPCRSSPTRSPAATRTPAGRPSARS